MRVIALVALGFLAGCGANGQPEDFDRPAGPAASGPDIDISGTATIGVSGSS